MLCSTLPAPLISASPPVSPSPCDRRLNQNYSIATVERFQLNCVRLALSLRALAKMTSRVQQGQMGLVSRNNSQLARLLPELA